MRVSFLSRDVVWLVPQFKTSRWLCLALVATVVLSGCRGCNDPLVERKKKLEEERKEKEKPKEDFEFQLPHTVPQEETSVAPLVKPGQWDKLAHAMNPSNLDIQAELYSSSTDRNERPYLVTDTAFTLSSSRPAPLPKGQLKRFETPFFIHNLPGDDANKTLGLLRELRAARGGRLVKKDWQPVRDEMDDFQYFLIVLAGSPDRYGYLKRLTAIAAPANDDFAVDRDEYLYYRVLLPQLERNAPLPSNSLTWTSTAYILWDDADPAILLPDQQTALLDWLHWGGQLIISGPSSLEKLQGTFLGDYLPAKPTQAVELDQAAVEEINQYWSLPNRKTNEVRTLDVLPGKPMLGIGLEKHPQADFVPHTGQLVVERRIGGGRIVVTSFALSDRVLINWGSFDSFFNACLLRRPRREFTYDQTLVGTRWPDYHARVISDARMSTTLRYFSRDVGRFDTQARTAPVAASPANLTAVNVPSNTTSMAQPMASLTAVDVATAPLPPEAVDPPGDDWHLVGRPEPHAGIAGWNDRSGAAEVSRNALKVAAGISIPRGDFVLKTLVCYLAVLVPINWGLFRLMGRVEWAWVAAPVMALCGAVVVVRMAQLDIGFARSVTEVAIAEVQAGYPRAHLTRYTAMYTSLSSSYDLVFADESSLAQPFGSEPGYVPAPQDPRYAVSLRRDRQLLLSGFQVPSNSTKAVHCEQMTDLGGAFAWQGQEATGFQLTNGTPIPLLDAGVLRRNANGGLEHCWLGEVPAGATLPVTFRPVDERQLRFSQWDASRVTQKVAESGELSLGGLIDLATENWKLRRGDVRLIGRSEAAMPGMEIRPTAAQEERHTMFLVHLQRGAWNEPRPDVNCKLDYVDEIFPDDPAPLGGASDPLAPAAQPESGLGTGKLPGT